MHETHQAVDATLTALADPTRRGVIELLSQGPRRAGALASHFGLSAPAMSRHLRLLRQSGLVEEGRSDPNDARVRHYRLRRERFDDLQSWLTEVRAVWTTLLGAFVAHAEARSNASPPKASANGQPRANDEKEEKT